MEVDLEASGAKSSKSLSLACETRVMTNLERCRRGFTLNLDFSCCPGKVEDADHLFQFCSNSFEI